MDMGYLLLIVASTVIGAGAQAYVTSQINKYTQVPTSTGLTGAQAANNMLYANGVTGVPIQQGSIGEDYFDPTTNSITIDPDAYGLNSVTSLATACHEVGHACQYAEGYTMMKIRSSLVPVVNLASNAWMPLLLIGIAMNALGLINAAIVLYAVAVLFHLVTLPVEFNASHRAMNYMSTINMSAEEQKGAFSVLRACALTYVAAALVSALQLLWMLSQRR